MARWWPEQIDAAAKSQLLRAFRECLVDDWEQWDEVDGCHCAEHRADLRRDLYLGVDLGLDVEDLLTIRDYPEEGSGSAYEEMRPETTRTVRLTRPNG